MGELSSQVRANMNVVLEEVCAELPHGGDHESRKFIAEQLIEAAEAGQNTLGELKVIARCALMHLQNTSRTA